MTQGIISARFYLAAMYQNELLPHFLQPLAPGKGKHHSFAFEGNKIHSSYVNSSRVMCEWMLYKYLEGTDENIWDMFHPEQ